MGNTESKPLVTIVTTTFNLIEAGREKYFRQCVKSVRQQSYPNIEYLIIDGASKDGTIDILKEYAVKGWITYISEPDSGIYNAMNKGIKLAEGKYIAFLNSDDYYHNHSAVALSVAALEKEKADFSYGNLVVIGENGKYQEKGELEKFIYRMPFGHPTMFTKKSVLEKENGFDESFKLPADYDLVIRLILKNYKGVYVDRIIANYRIGGLGSTNDHSEEIGRIYLKNYSVFHKFSSTAQAENIMFKSKLPLGFIENFTKYAGKKNLKNLDYHKAAELLINNLEEERNKNNPEDLKKQKPDSVNVFLSSDNNYAPFVATTICSIMDHTDSFVNFYILDGGISWLNTERIKQVQKRFPNFSIEFIEVNTEHKFKDFPTRLHFSSAMYTRFMIPELKPQLGKVIYSDVDVIFNGDVKEIINEDLGSYSLGAVPYSFGYLNPDQREIRSFQRRLKLSGSHKYFESGLLVMDTEKWRKEGTSHKLLDLVKKCKKDEILTPDQDVLNIFFDSNYTQLDNKYIVVPEREKIMESNPLTASSIKAPFIYHFAGRNKPWLYPGIEYADDFWKYAKITPFYEEIILESAKKNAANKSGLSLRANLVKNVRMFLRKLLQAVLKILPSFLKWPLRKMYNLLKQKLGHDEY